MDTPAAGIAIQPGDDLSALAWVHGELRRSLENEFDRALAASVGLVQGFFRVEIAEAFAAVPALYIADGHHRAASAWRTHQQLAAEGPGEHERFLAVAFPDVQMQVLPYNRVVRDLSGLTPDAFRAALAAKMKAQPPQD